MKQSYRRLVVLGLAVVAASAWWIGCQTGGDLSGRGGMEPLFQPAGQGGEQWTILCRHYNASEAPNHAVLADQMADMLRQVKDLRANQVRVETTPTGSSIYYGTYRRVASKQTGRLVFPEQFQRDIELIRSLSYGRFTPFFQAEPHMTGGREGGAFAQWDISKAEGPLTLLIARFYNTAGFDQRMETAEQYCSILRQEGYPAYYEHQEVRSFVYVGDFKFSDRYRPEIRDRQGNIRTGMWRLGPNVEALVARNPDEFRYITDNGHLIRQVGPDGRALAEQSYLVETRREKGANPDMLPY